MTQVTHQQVDFTRPVTLMTRGPRFSPQLMYQYLDTDEVIIVPNVWYNRAAEYNQQTLLDEARDFDIQASMIESGETYCHPFTRAAVSASLRLKAWDKRAQHRKTEAQALAPIPRNTHLEPTS